MNCSLLQRSPWYCTLFLTAFLSADILTFYDLVNYCQAFYSLQQSTGASNVHVPYSFPTWRFASDKLIVLAKTVFLSVSLIEIKPKNCWVTFWFPFSVFHVKNLALNMKLTADLILQSPQYTNALRDRELDLRGKFSCLTFTPKGYLPLISNVSPISFVFSIARNCISRLTMTLLWNRPSCFSCWKRTGLHQDNMILICKTGRVVLKQCPVQPKLALVS